MPTRPLTAKQASFVQYYADSGSETYNNAMQSAIKAGYAETTAEKNSKVILDYVGVKQAIVAYKAKTTVKLEHNRTIAIELLNEALAMARKQANTTAIIAATRELNAISNLHNQTITTVSDTTTIPASDTKLIEEQTRLLNIKLASTETGT